MTNIETKALEASTLLLATGLTTEAAHAFLESLPKVEDMMPAVQVSEVQELLSKKVKSDFWVRHRLRLEDGKELDDE